MYRGNGGQKRVMTSSTESNMEKSFMLEWPGPMKVCLSLLDQNGAGTRLNSDIRKLLRILVHVRLLFAKRH